jgi:hypothetical protein
MIKNKYFVSKKNLRVVSGFSESQLEEEEGSEFPYENVKEIDTDDERGNLDQPLVSREG